MSAYHFTTEAEWRAAFARQMEQRTAMPDPASRFTGRLERKWMHEEPLRYSKPLPLRVRIRRRAR